MSGGRDALAGRVPPPRTMDDSSLLMVKLDGMDQAKCKLDSISSEGRGVMKLTSEQIATELQALHNAVEESFSHVENHVLPSRRDQRFRLLQLVAGVLRQEQRACAFGTWQEMDVEQIAGELQALQTAVNHVVDLIVNDQIIAELSAKSHDDELQALTDELIAMLRLAPVR